MTAASLCCPGDRQVSLALCQLQTQGTGLRFLAFVVQLGEIARLELALRQLCGGLRGVEDRTVPGRQWLVGLPPRTRRSSIAPSEWQSLPGLIACVCCKAIPAMRPLTLTRQHQVQEIERQEYSGVVGQARIGPGKRTWAKIWGFFTSPAVTRSACDIPRSARGACRSALLDSAC